MIQRHAEEALKRLASQFPIVGITGPRQSGKTTIAQMTFPQKKYVTLDDRSLRDLASDDPKDFLKAFPDGAIIDEAQKVPYIFDALKQKVDSEEYEPGKYILTGSSQFRLRENMTDSLAGRAAFLKLLPLSIAEKDEGRVLDEEVYNDIFKGGYPPLYDENKSYIAEDWFEAYLDTYLDLDVKDQIRAENISAFRKFIQLCAVYSGSMLSMDRLARDTGVSAPTIKKWISVLENSYIIYLLEPDVANLGKKLVKTPKLYFYDAGLLCYLLRIKSVEELHLSRHKGAVVETYAISEMMKYRFHSGKKPNLSYFRDNKGFEIDVIADWDEPRAIEIKSGDSPSPKMSENVKKYISLKEDSYTKGEVFYLGDLTLEIGDVKYVGWKDWQYEM